MITKPVPGVSGYSARDDGWVIGRNGAPMTGWIDEDGYRQLSIRMAGRRTAKRVAAHKMVALAFHGVPPLRDPEVCHADGNPMNNAPENLRWGTASDNAADRVRHGSCSRERNGRTRVTPRLAILIRGMRTDGASQQSIADTLGVGQATISRVLRGEHYTARSDG